MPTARRRWRACRRGVRRGAAAGAGPAADAAVEYGAYSGTGGVARNLRPHWVNPWIILTTLARMLSFASLEIARFIATDGPKRLEFFARHLWLAPAAVLVWVIGVVQPLWMLVDLARPAARWPSPLPRPQWIVLRRLLVGSVLMIYASYWFVIEPPQAHAFYVLSPIVLVFAAFWWTLIDSPRARQAAAGVLALNVFFHAGLAWSQRAELSLYKNRAPGGGGDSLEGAGNVRAPARLRGRRRTGGAAGSGPPVSAGQRPRSRRRPPPRRAARLVALDDRRAQSQHGRRLPRSAVCDRRTSTSATRSSTSANEFLKDIFQPGGTWTIDVNDGYVRGPFTDARLEIVAAEALIPAAAGRLGVDRSRRSEQMTSRPSGRDKDGRIDEIRAAQSRCLHVAH